MRNWNICHLHPGWAKSLLGANVINTHYYYSDMIWCSQWSNVLEPLSLSGLIQQTTNWWYYSNFSQKRGFDISCKWSPLETICIKCQILFSGICGPLKILNIVQSVKSQDQLRYISQVWSQICIHQWKMIQLQQLRQNGFCLPSEKGLLKRKEFAPKKSKLFPFRVDPFQKRAGVQESQRKRVKQTET